MEGLVQGVFGSDATVKAISSDTVLLVITVPRHTSQKSFKNFEKNAKRIADKVKGIPVVVVHEGVTVDAVVTPTEQISPKRLSEQQQQEQVDDDYERKEAAQGLDEPPFDTSYQRNSAQPPPWFFNQLRP